jgi:hypothetical protein
MKQLRNILPHSVWNKRAGVLYVPISGQWESKGLEQQKKKVSKSSTFKDVIQTLTGWYKRNWKQQNIADCILIYLGHCCQYCTILFLIFSLIWKAKTGSSSKWKEEIKVSIKEICCEVFTTLMWCMIGFSDGTVKLRGPQRIIILEKLIEWNLNQQLKCFAWIAT